MTARASPTTGFEESLMEIGVGYSRTTVGEFETTLSAVVDGPTVGVPLGWTTYPDFVETDPSTEVLRAAKTGVTPVAFAVAETGTVAVRSTAGGDEPFSLYPERHVAVVPEVDVLTDLSAAFLRLEGLFADRESVVFATGASATADMGELVEGVHGPTSVHVVVVTDAPGGTETRETDDRERAGGKFDTDDGLELRTNGHAAGVTDGE
jgi:L-lactate dehydrogenase complex protein LldG